MNKDECIAQGYLRHIGFVDIRHHPDGQHKSPDFLVDGRIAVEVRRLNQNVTNESGETEGLEEARIPIQHRIGKCLRELGPSRDGESWHVSFTMWRPIEPWRVLEREIRLALQDFMDSPRRTNTRLQITEHLELSLMRAGPFYETFFVHAGTSDRDSVGWVLPDMHRNIKHCIEEKDRKVSRVWDQYSIWWLVLIDHISLGFSLGDHGDLRDLPRIEHSWEKVIVVSLLDPRRAFEI